ncbi:MAG: Molybdopterin biosynthesis protein MoeB [Microgenomates group bacterium GW2011_GWC1_43_13]|uniref:Molybdopterin biosynthesis protein MoeB n=3 Tax=Candidatus Woeseibacteriota TaxID=1752722 RepID=A0A837IDK0_9BACT|nr:MAG: Molybdopterin biosynthesis protein MoeB [Microgenomates group bacterium GW2011_GWC1_43_13]KKT32722.1 MAG: Molybdopterin biosynthesis protein MoeB [Candidatus Woesebacteria bacterium GW2011_GWB1_44_11]KKT54829.1 MAG: Molybdopterin biosynthesis protein MoeB [Candidatus Woesebacteria bacterium GW2011_GWA1_44_23]OGM75992.1 MAG: hypothetical protein A2208_02850 [Candidatus Woesebacteria bacterium RIFOXYA1_FULL_43_16]OGM82512.1 MAG: hypothetical protein A2394_00050 [Candidatus Woesebacteria b
MTEIERYKNFEGLIEDVELTKLQQSRILIAGCGAGGPVALHLARIGVGTKNFGKITLADPDKVEWRNIGRPPYLFADAQEGTAKIYALGSIVKNINPEVNLSKVEEGITLGNVDRLVIDSDVVIEMVDISQPQITFALHQACEKHRKPLVTGLDLGDNIIMYVFNYHEKDITSYTQFLGLPPDITSEDFDNFNPLAIAAQFIIGKQECTFATKDDALSFYGDSFFASEANINDVFKALPHDIRTINMIQNILNGQIEHIAQSDIASQLLGTAQALAVKEIILGNPVKTSPKPIRIYLTEMVSA